MLGVFVGSAALVIILSVFNGFGDLVLSMYNTFTSEIRIEPARGKTFDPQTAYFQKLRKDQRISGFVEVLQENVLVRYENEQYIGLVKGVSDDFARGKQLDSIMVDGSFLLKDRGRNFAVLGIAAQASLGVSLRNNYNYLEFYSPRKGAARSINPAEQFVQKIIRPSGIFQLQDQFDHQIFVPIEFARELMEEERNVSAIELNVANDVQLSKVLTEISKDLGKDYVVKNRGQQNQLIYKILNSEKIAVFLILTFVLIIAIFNIIGSLTMLVMDKSSDIAVLNSMGANSALIRSVFFTEGMMISIIGCVLGMLTGWIFCLLQQHYGLVKMDMGLITDYYPVVIKYTDFLIIFGTVTTISIIASSISSRLSIKNVAGLKANL